MESIADILSKNNKYLSLTSSNRIKCEITGHEMPIDVKIVQQYLSSSKFKKAYEWYSQDYSKYLPYLIPHKSGDNRKLFCILTKKSLSKIPKEVEKHVNGKKFLRLKQEYEEKWKNSSNNKNIKAKGEESEDGEDEDDDDISDSIWFPDDDILNENDPNSEDKEEDEDEISETSSHNSSIKDYIISSQSKRKRVEQRTKDNHDENRKSNQPIINSSVNKSVLSMSHNQLVQTSIKRKVNMNMNRNINKNGRKDIVNLKKRKRDQNMKKS